MQYTIPYDKLESLKHDLQKVERKCKQLGFEFKYEEVGETFKFIDELDAAVKFVIIEVDGLAKIDGWQVVAYLEHTDDDKNLIYHIASDFEIPHMYYNSKPKCDHCNTNRFRKYTYLLYNAELDQWKQVGKSCLKDFTGKWNADNIAAYYSYFDILKENDCSDILEDDTFAYKHSTLYYDIPDKIYDSIEFVDGVEAAKQLDIIS